MNDPYNSTVLHEDLIAAGLEIAGCTSKGRIDWKKPPSASDKAKAEAVLKAHKPTTRPSRESRLDALRTKRRAGQVLTAAEQQELMDLLLGV